MMSLKTWAAFCVRATSSSRSEATASGATARAIVEKIRRRFNIDLSSFAIQQLEIITRDVHASQHHTPARAVACLSRPFHLKLNPSQTNGLHTGHKCSVCPRYCGG